MRRAASAVLSAAATVLILSGVAFHTRLPLFGHSPLLAQEGWRAEYEAVCSETDVAMTLSVEELKDLIAQCDRLKPQIEAQEESTRKVYLRRLQMCRDLYLYILQTKETK